MSRKLAIIISSDISLDVYKTGLMAITSNITLAF